MKKLFIAFAVFFALSVTAQAQQLTRFAVVDLPRVYLAFFNESRAVRDFEAQSARVQAELDRMSAEIHELRVNMVNAQAQGNFEQALRFEAEINRRTNFQREYHRVRTEELQIMRNRLTQSGAFLEQVYDEIRFVAESQGFSMVLNKTDNNGILWYSPNVDITNLVIQNMMTRARR